MEKTNEYIIVNQLIHSMNHLEYLTSSQREATTETKHCKRCHEMSINLYNNSKTLIKIKNMFGFYWDIWGQKLTFSYEISQKDRTQGKKLLLPKMITPTSSIYAKIFRLLSFEIVELGQVQLSWITPPWSLPLEPPLEPSISDARL
jgi:hypothetical protein